MVYGTLPDSDIGLVAGQGARPAAKPSAPTSSPPSMAPRCWMRWAAQAAGVSLSDTQGNAMFQDLRFHGFEASPLQGTPQGIAVYQNGVRLNEAFGDTVNWDAIPASRHRAHGCVEQQSGVRPERAGRRGQSW